jgi:type VI secretion system protein ImpA
MAPIDFAALTEPLSDAAPCGPDLDVAGDLEFMNYLARAEGLLPSTFFTRDSEGRLTPFDRSAIALADEAKTIADFLTRTRDLRLLTLLAKFEILNRDLPGFARTLDATSRLLAERWDDVHPRGEDGDYTLRMVTLQTLDDSPTVILPLQHAPLVPSRRFGAITFRNVLVRRGEAAAREDEETPDDSAIEASFREIEFPALAGIRDSVRLLRDALASIRALWLERAGYDQALTFEKLAPLAEKMLGLLEDAVARRDPTAAAVVRAEADGDAPGPGPATHPGGAARMASLEDARAALAAAEAYFAKHEPSSPALLLVRQAQDLIGKTFGEVIETLLPSHADQAAIRFGVDGLFELPVQRLSGLAPGDGMFADEAMSDPPPLDESGPAQDGADPDGQDAPVAPAAAARAVRVAARSRQEATALLEQVGAFYRAHEPASPIPLLTERACGLSQRDFLTLLKDVLPGLKASTSD